LILLKDGVLHFVEIKSGMTYSISDVKAFKQLGRTKYKIGESGIVCPTSRFYSISSNTHVIPIVAI
jgi:hypothetical protein